MSCKLSRPDTVDEAVHLLGAGHERACHCLEMLGKLTLWVSEHGADAAARQAAATVLRHFRGEAVRQYRDEEEHVFPRLLARANEAERPTVASLVSVLVADHGRLRAAWEQLADRIESIAAGRAVSLGGADVRDFRLKLCSHIECEQTRLLPLMQRLFDAADHAAIGGSLRARGGARTLPGSRAGA
jgi:hemerythrin-like domain-containing protein